MAKKGKPAAMPKQTPSMLNMKSVFLGNQMKKGGKKK